MRVRMLNRPETIRQLNDEAVAMKVNATAGFPSGFPALGIVERAFERVPFARLNFSFYMLPDSAARRLVGGSGCRYEVAMELGRERVFTLLPEQLRGELRDYRRSRALAAAAKRDPAAAARLAELAGAPQVIPGGDPVDAMRAWWLAHRADPDRGVVWADAPAMRNEFVHTAPAGA